jgi:hypothetical protein
MPLSSGGGLAQPTKAGRKGLPDFPSELPRPPSAHQQAQTSAFAAAGSISNGGKLDAKWMANSWQSVRAMERKWERLRDARGDAVHAALQQASAVISEVRSAAATFADVPSSSCFCCGDR